MTQPYANVDYAVQAKAALTAIERFSTEIEALPQKSSMCREKWRDYGAALLAQRLVTPSDQAFGAWVKANGLDQGRAARHGVRADAMWLAEHFDSVQPLHTVTQHHPTGIREQCRAAGYAWAGETAHQSERKAHSVRMKAQQARYSWHRTASSEGLPFGYAGAKFGGGSQRKQIREELQAIEPDPQLFDADKEARLREVCQIWLARREPQTVSPVIAAARASLPESMQARFDKAIAKIRATFEGAYQAKYAELQNGYESEVAKAVAARIAPDLEYALKHARDAQEHWQKEIDRFQLRSTGIKQAMTKADYQLVLGCLHPDRPDRTPERLNAAFAVLKRLQPYIDSFD